MTLPLESVACASCGGRETSVRFETPSPWNEGAAAHFAATTDVFGAYGTVVECRACGLVFTDPRPAPAALLAGYADNDDPDYESERDARCMNAYLSLAVLRRRKPGGRLLEIGCAQGFFLNAARTSFETVGVEPSRAAREYARSALKLDVPAATLEEARFDAASFDAVVLIDVIEHVADPLGLLKECARLLKPGGIVYLVTPDIASLSARLLRGRWWGLRPAHVYYFSRATMTAMLQKAGLEVLEVRSYGRIFTWGYWLSRLANYPRPLRAPLAALIDLLGIRDKFLYLDTRDSMQVVSRLPTGALTAK